ncbi:MAG: hypothetical protein ACXAAI_08375 [Promethearchaeota archaeon]
MIKKLNKELSISLFGGIWALFIFLSPFSGWYFFNLFSFPYLLMGGGAIGGVLVSLLFNEKYGNIICLWSCIGFIIIQTVISWGHFLIGWFFISGGTNYAPLILILIGSIFGYLESRKINTNHKIKTEGKRVLNRGLSISLIGGIVSWLIPIFFDPILGYNTIIPSTYLILTWGAIIGMIIGLIFNEKIGSIICIGSGIIYLLVFVWFIGIFYFIYIIQPFGFNLAPLTLISVGGIIGYAESRNN